MAGAVAWSTLVSKLPAKFPGRVGYLPLAPAVEVSGKYSAWLPPLGAGSVPPASWVRVRMVDNTHFCPAGAARYAAALLVDLHAEVGLGATSRSWWDGSWSSSPVYRSTAGACPADHPA